MAKSALGVMKEYAEKPFRLWDMRGKQFTIVEDLPKTKMIRETQGKAQKTGKPYTLYLIKVQEGMFEKDLQLYETDLETLFLKCPTSLINYKGVIMTLSMSENPVLTYIGQATPEMNENFPKPPQSPQTVPGQQINRVEGLYAQLAQAITLCQKIGQKTTKEIVVQVARNIVAPGQDVEAFVHAAKMAGWLVERDGIFSGTA